MYLPYHISALDVACGILGERLLIEDTPTQSQINKHNSKAKEF